MKAIRLIWQRVLNLTPHQAILFLFLTAFLVRITIVVIFHTYRDLGRYELERTAISLATTGVYGNPYAIPTGPTAHVSPGYTLILAALFRIFGTGIPAEIIKQVLASAISSLVCALLPWAASGFLLSRSAGILAGLICALCPATPLVQVDGDWETPYTALALILLSVLTARLWRQRDLTVRKAVLHGAAWGISLLFVSALFAMLIVLIIAGFYFCRGAGPRRYMQFAVTEALVVALCLAPWAVRNYSALGFPILTRSNPGLELRVSNNDEASPDQRINYLNGVYAKYHPLLNKNEALKVRDLGEVAYNKQAESEAKQWIRTHPWRFLGLCLGRARCFWLYSDPSSRMKTLFLNATVLLGLAGLVFVFRRDVIAGSVMALVLIIYPLPNYLVHVGLRQEYPIEWLMTLLAAALIVSLAQKLSVSSQVTEAHARH